MTNNLQVEFTNAMFDLYTRTKLDTNYNPTVFHDMLLKDDGVKTAKTLLHTTEPSSGYTKLWELHRLDLTVEAFIWDNPKFHELFSPEELNVVKKRLTDFEYLK
ncbi:MAG: hypothetical protein ABFD50_11300 [Smithella sp.]